jgi:hypothetical protein
MSPSFEKVTTFPMEIKRRITTCYLFYTHNSWYNIDNTNNNNNNHGITKEIKRSNYIVAIYSLIFLYLLITLDILESLKN